VDIEIQSLERSLAAQAIAVGKQRSPPKLIIAFTG
jgi:hypothetical protein